MVQIDLDEAGIERLVRTFYARVAEDPMLGPIFDARIQDWETHIRRMCDFWSSVALRSGRYHGSPVAAHAPLPVDSSHFDCWLALFEETAREVCAPRAADALIERAGRIARSLELSVASHHGVLLSKEQRFVSPHGR